MTPQADPAVGIPFSFEISPGDTRRNVGEDQLIIASARGFSPQSVTLLFRDVGDTDWREQQLEGDGEDFTGYLRAIDKPTEYFVRAGGAQSSRHLIDVVTPPTLESIELTYHYPAYTGRAPERVSNGEDIRAPRGTEVAMRLHVSNAPRGGRLVVDGDRHYDLIDRGENGYEAALKIESNGRYRVELVAEDGEHIAVSPEYSIEALEDTLPTLSLRTPAQDTTVTSLEEVDVAVDAADDIGVQLLELVLSINGGEEESLAFPADADDLRLREAVRTLFLEDRELQPGDLIAYYARARDAVATSQRQDVTTDIYFMEVRPFEREYHADEGGGGGGGGGGQQQEQLAAQQRELVVALFNAVRDKERTSDDEHRGKLEKIASAQTRIRDRVEAIVRRLKSRGIVRLDPGYRQMVVELPKAVSAMLDVESALQSDQDREAQTPARTALLHLQRAEAAFRSVRVAQSDARGNNSGDLRNLFRLEMDRFRNQYADVQRGQWQNSERQMDEVLDELRELARRQQRETERAQLRSQRGAEGGANSQAALAAEAEEMARQLERLSLQDPELRELAERVRKAAESMRSAANSQGTGQGTGESREALRQLQEARDQLRQSGQRRLASAIEEASRELGEMQGEQERLAARAASPEIGPTERDELGERKRGMQEELGDVRDRLEQLSRQAADRNEVRRDIAGAARELSDSVARNLAHTERLLTEGRPSDPRAENAISEGLRSAQERLASAAEGIGGSEAERLARAREQLGDVVRGLTGMAPGAGDEFFGGGDGQRRRPQGDIVNMRDALRANADVLRGLSTGLDSRRKEAGEIEHVIDGLIGLAEQTDSGVVDEQRLAELLKSIREIDYALRDKTVSSADPARGFAPRHVQPEAEHRALVESYFRELSEDNTSSN